MCIQLVWSLPAAQFTPQGRICAALCTCTYSTDVARNLPCGHSTSGEGLLTRATTFFSLPPTFSMAEARSTNEKGAMERSREMVETLEEG